MGSLILCHSKRAEQPYVLKRLHTRIYSLEELCYCLCNHLYLVDYTIMNSQLCLWIENELGLVELAEKLREELSKNCSEDQFIVTLIEGCGIYDQEETNRIMIALDYLKNQKDVEKAKYKADTLMDSREYASAALIYQMILRWDWDDSLDRSFYGKIYACLGAAYGRLFLYSEAAVAYKNAYEIMKDEKLLRTYLYCEKKSHPEDEYVRMLSGNPQYLKADAELKEAERITLIKHVGENSSRSVEDWKKDYKRTNLAGQHR